MARKNKLKNFYFTFGTCKTFPYQNGYLIVKATSRETAVARFQRKYADPNDSCINCSFIYSEKEWNDGNVGRHYKEPIEILSIEDELND